MRKLLFIISIYVPSLLFGQELDALNVGDKVPDVFLSTILNHTTPSANLSDFMDKPLIIDFWFRECGSCITAMPHLDSLQKEYVGKLNIIFSTHQSKDKIEDFFETHHIGKNLKFTNIVGDTILRQLFPAAGFPHQVWIDSNGIVAAITDGQSTTRENIEKLISGIPLDLKEKKDEMDFSVRSGEYPLITYFNEQKSSILQYSFLGKYREGFSGGSSRSTDTLNNITRLSMRNMDFLWLYDYAYCPPMGSYEELHRPTRMLRKDSNPIATEADYNTFSNIFCYDLIYQGHLDNKKQSDIMIKDLDIYFNVNSTLETHQIPCYIIRDKKGSSSKKYQKVLFHDVKPFIENERLEIGKKWIVNNIAGWYFKRTTYKGETIHPCIFEGDTSLTINFEVIWNPEDLTTMNLELSKYDLEIVVEKRDRKIIVLRDR